MPVEPGQPAEPRCGNGQAALGAAVLLALADEMGRAVSISRARAGACGAPSNLTEETFERVVEVVGRSSCGPAQEDFLYAGADAVDVHHSADSYLDLLKAIDPDRLGCLDMVNVVNSPERFSATALIREWFKQHQRTHSCCVHKADHTPG